MNLDEYIELRKKELADFASHWEKQRSINPGMWPESFPEGDWFDQELAYLSSIGKEGD